MLVVNSASIYLRLRTLLVAGVLFLVAGTQASAQDGQPTEDAAEAVASGASEQVRETEDAAGDAAAPASEDTPAASEEAPTIPAIEVTQPAQTSPAESQVTGDNEPRVAAVPPQRHRPTSYNGAGYDEGVSGASGATDAQGNPNGTGTGESAWGPVDGYVATRSGTGTKTDTPLREIPQSISVITREEMRDQGVQTLQDALRYTAGVVADGYGIDSRTDTPLIRGITATEYLDGLRRTFNYYIYDYRIDPYFMERIEVLRGPTSVLYGQAEVGGIVNSISKRPQQEQYSEITAEYGTFDFKQVKFDTTGAITADGNWSYRLTGLARDAETQVNFVDDDRMALQPAITWQPQDDTSITLLGHFQKDHTGSTQQFLPHVGTIFPNARGNFIPWDAFVGEPSDKYDTDVASGTLIVEHDFNDALTLRNNTRYTDIHNIYNAQYPGFFFTGVPYLTPQQNTIDRAVQLTDTDTQIFNSDTNLEAQFETGVLSHKLLGGFDYADFRAQQRLGLAMNLTPFNVYNPVYGQPATLFDVLCEPGPVAEVPLCDQPDQHVRQMGFYVQDQLRLSNWIAVLGARHDRVDNSTEGSPTQKDTATSYRAGLMYELPFGLTPYVSYTESFVPEVGLTFGGSTFDPRQGEMVEVGFKYQSPGADFTINGAVYDITESNRLASDPAHPGFSIQAGEVSSRGFEIEAVGNVTPDLRLIASYSYTDAEYTGGDQAGFRVESVPEHLSSLWAVKDLSLFGSDGFSVGGGVRYVGSSWDGTDTLKTPAFTVFDAMAAYETEYWRFQINGTNLGDKEYLTTCLARGDCFRGTGRTIIAGITRRW